MRVTSLHHCGEPCAHGLTAARSWHSTGSDRPATQGVFERCRILSVGVASVVSLYRGQSLFGRLKSVCFETSPAVKFVLYPLQGPYHIYDSIFFSGKSVGRR